MLRRSPLFAALAGIAMLSPIGTAHAVPPGEIVLGDITVFRLRAPSGKLTALQRADAVQDRLTEVLSIPDLKEKDVSVQMTNYGPTIYVCKIKLLTINAEDAKAAGMTPLELAKLWAHRLAGVLPQVNIRLPSAKPSPTPSAPGNPPAVSPTPTETPAATPTPDTTPAPPPPATPMPTPTPAPAPTPMPTPTPAAPATPA